MNDSFARFTIVDDKERELTRLVADVMLYFYEPLSDHKDDVVAVIDRFYELVPVETLGWYATETMTQFKPTTKRSFKLPEVWWKRGVKRMPLREVKLKSAERHDSVASAGLYLSSAEREHSIFDYSANYLRFLVPVSWATTQYDRLFDFAVFVANRLPFASGHGGYTIETNPYFPNDAQGAAYPLAMRFQAVDIATMSRGPWAVRGDRIKNVGWLTLIGNGLLAKIGGKPALQNAATNGLEVSFAKYGAVIRAGAQPVLGDVNRQENLAQYREAYRLVAPLQAGIEMVFPPLDLPGDTDEIVATARWLFRFRKQER